MTAAVVTVAVPLRFTAEVRGKAALRLLKLAGVPRLYDYRPASGLGACWTCPAARVPDLLAAGDTLRGVRVVVEPRQQALL